MTFTVATDCQQVTITSPYLATTNQSVTLKVTRACGGTVTSIPVSVLATSIIVTPASIGLATLDLNVYTFELTVVQQNGTKVIDTRCLFLSCDAACSIKDVLKLAVTDSESYTKALAYYALVNSNLCPDCSCQDLCDLFNIAFNTNENAGCTGCNQH